MNKRKVLLPAISIGLLTAARPAVADVIDLGVVAERIVIGSTISGLTLAGNTIGGFTVNGLAFVGSHLNDVINGNTVDSILEDLLGPQNEGTVTFDLPSLEGASGGLAFNGNFTVTAGQVTISGLPVLATVTDCVPSVPGTPALPGCHAGFTVNINPFDVAGMIGSMENAQIISLPGTTKNGGSVTNNFTVNIPLGFDAAGNQYQAEEIESFTSESAAQVPEPTSVSLAGLGMAALAWWRRLRSRRG